ncbi:MAG: glycosyltransferase family 2 protein [Thermoleophilia bacterium]
MNPTSEAGRQAAAKIVNDDSESADTTAVPAPASAVAPAPQAARPRVSVVIPVYNGARTMPAVLAALDKSIYRDFETVLIHDHSTDNTSEVLADLAERYRFRLFEFPENRGVSKARNTGAKEARGEILLYIDADCIVLPETIGLCVEQLRAGDSVCVGGAYTKSAWDQDFYSNFQSLYVHYVETKTESPDYIATHCMAIYKKTFTDFGGFREDYFIGHAASVEDVEFSHRLMAAGHRISRPYGIEVQHMFNFGLKKSLKNAVKKSKYWTMYSLYNKDITKDSGAASYELKLNVLTQVANIPLVLAALLLGYSWLFLPVGIFLAMNLATNLRLLRMMRQERGWVFLLKAMVYYFFVYPYAVAYGAFAGIIKYILEVKLSRKYS